MKVYLGIKFEYNGEWYGDYVECDLDNATIVAFEMSEQIRQVYEKVKAQRKEQTAQ